MKIKVKNITYKEFLEADIEKQAQYLYYLKFLKPVDVYGFGEFMNCSFEFVKDIQSIFASSDGMTFIRLLEVLESAKGKEFITMSRLTLFELHQQRLFFYEQIKGINNAEREALSYYPTAREAAAGIEVFESYKSFTQFDSLANGDITKIEQIKKLPYKLCFTKLKLDKDRSDYQKRLNNIK